MLSERLERGGKRGTKYLEFRFGRPFAWFDARCSLPLLLQHKTKRISLNAVHERNENVLFFLRVSSSPVRSFHLVFFNFVRLVTVLFLLLRRALKTWAEYAGRYDGGQ